VTIYRVTCTPSAQPGARSDPLAVPSPIADYRPSLAVLPFRTLQADQADAYFAAGMVDDIIRVLGGFRAMLVIARGSTLGFAGPSVDLRRIGAELGVRYVLYGSVQRSGERVRIAAELGETETGNVIWADRFDGVLADLFELQDRISLRVAAIIAPHVRERELRRAMRKRPESMSAYDLVLQALDLLHRNTIGPFLQAGDLLRQAMALDPSYAPPYSHMALWHMLRVAQGWSDDRAADGRAAAQAAEAAVTRDPGDAQALAICGHTQSYMHRNYTTAAEFLERALIAGPNCAIAWSLSSLTCGYLGDGKTAVRRAEYGLRLSPLAPDVYMFEHFLSLAHYVDLNYEESVAWAQRSLVHNPAHTSTLRTLVAGLAGLGRLDEARTAAAEMMAQDPGFGLAAFADRTPLPDPLRRRFVDHLRSAGVPD
jgi:TolB-like protein